MDEFFEEIKKKSTGFFKRKHKLILIAILVCMLTSILSAFDIFKEDGSYKDGDSSNTPYAVQQHTSNVNIDSDGNIVSGMTAQELWDQMIEDGSRVDKYLGGPEELQKLINAQRVTDYLDTRGEDEIDEEIDWETLNNDVNSTNIQGIIKLKRAKADGTVSTLIYADPETFQSYVDEYNSSGSEEDKQRALKYFTLEKDISQIQVLDQVLQLRREQLLIYQVD